MGRLSFPQAEAAQRLHACEGWLTRHSFCLCLASSLNRLVCCTCQRQFRCWRPDSAVDYDPADDQYTTHRLERAEALRAINGAEKHGADAED